MPKRSLPPIRRAVHHVRGALTAPEKWLYAGGVLSPAGLALPSFLGIGAQKSATTWLFHNLVCHPDLFLPSRKEVHYFDWWFHETLRSYARRFEPGRGKICGEVTPAYAVLQPERIRFIRTIMPDLRMIFLMRNPIDRAWSHALMDLVWRPGRRFEDVPAEQFYRHFERSGPRARGDYGACIDRWLAEYPADRLYLGYFEDVISRPQWLLTEILQFLGTRTDVDWSAFPLREPKGKHGSIKLPPEYRARLEELYGAQIEALYHRLGEPVKGWRVDENQAKLR